MPDAAARTGFACPDLTTFCRLDGLGLKVTGQRLEPERAVRRLAHEPLGWRPTVLEVVVRRYRCTVARVARVAEGLGVAWNTANGHRG